MALPVRPEILWREIRFSARSLLRSPILLVVSTLSLGLAIAATTTVYSLADALLIHDVSARAPERLVRAETALTYPQYRDVEQAHLFEQFGAWNNCSLRWRDGQAIRDVGADCLSANFFDLIDVHPALGRLFASDEAAPERDPRIVVLSDRFWRQQLQGDPRVIGRELIFNEATFAVIGVLPPSYRAIQGFGVTPDVYVPFSATVQPNFFEQDASVLAPIGRLLPDRGRPETERALNDLLRRVAAAKMATNVTVALTPAAGRSWRAEDRESKALVRFSLALGIVSLFVLTIACANVAGLLLTRASGARREIAVQLAMGATRAQVARRLMFDALLVAVAATVTGIWLTFALGSFVSTLEIPGLPLRFNFAPDWRLAFVAAAFGTIAAIGSGMIPALVSSRQNLMEALRVAGTAPASRPWLRMSLVAGQIAVSVVLLCGAFAFVRGLIHVVNVQPGFDVRRTAWFDVSLDRRLSRTDRAATRDRLYRDIEATAGVESVSWSWYLPFNLVYRESVVRRPEAATMRVTEQPIGPKYLATMGVPLVAGREFEMRDLDGVAERVPQQIILNQAMAQALFQTDNVVGERLERVAAGNRITQMVVVGVAQNSNFRTPGEAPVPLMHSLVPLGPSYIVRMSGTPHATAQAVARQISRTTPSAAVSYFTTADLFARGVWPARAATTLFGTLASVGLMLALIGLSGLSIYNVTRRIPEIGVRMALGATPGNIRRLMLMEGLSLVTIGALVGLGASIALGGALGTVLPSSVSALDPISLAAATATLLCTTALAVWVATARAASLPPSISLRAV